MNNEAIQSARFGAPLWRPLARSIAVALRARAGLLLAHVRETITGGGAARDRDDFVGMNAYMRRDVGAESSIGPHASAHRDLLYPRL
jgi:hypothetical protein